MAETTGPEVPSGGAGVPELDRATRVLTDLALRGLALSSHGVSLAQYRLLATLGEHGPRDPETVAAILRVGTATVRHQADRLAAIGLVRRNRGGAGDATIEPTPAGHRLIGRVTHWRHQELARILDRMDTDSRAAAVAALRAVAAAAAQNGYGRSPASGA